MSRTPQKLRRSLVALLLLAVGAGQAIAAEDAELAALQVKVGEMFAAIDPESVKRSPVDGWYTIHKGSIVAYISADGRYLLQGDMIDLDNEVNLTEQTRSDARQVLMSAVADDQVIAFTPAEVKHSVTVFTDVDCGYCRKLHSQIDSYLANGIEIRYLLYPRNGPASPSWSVAENVWCASDRNAALTSAKLDRRFETHKCKSSAITDNYALGRNVGLTGTPAIVLEDGSLLAGYLAPDQLAQHLQQATLKQ